ncbi:NEW3 domain-containing protein [Chloroflexota bacterium]
MKILRLVTFLCLLLVGLLAFSAPAITLAQGGEEATANATTPAPPPAPEINIEPTYPKLEAIAGSDFEFEVELSYFMGEETRDFDLKATAPPNWEVYFTPKYEKEKKVSAIRMEPFSSAEMLRVVVTAPYWPLPDPGEYTITVDISSGDLKGSTELTAVITARYMLAVVPVDGRYNTNAKPGEDNFFSVEVGNLGTAPIENIKFSTTKPEGWTIEFTPEKIETLDAFDSQTMEVNIKPPTDTIAGDYNITLRASGKQTSADEIGIRVTVETPTVWGWVGVGIIVVVIAGLIVVFMRFSRR